MDCYVVGPDYSYIGCFVHFLNLCVSVGCIGFWGYKSVTGISYVERYWALVFFVVFFSSFPVFFVSCLFLFVFVLVSCLLFVFFVVGFVVNVVLFSCFSS